MAAISDFVPFESGLHTLFKQFIKVEHELLNAHIYKLAQLARKFHNLHTLVKTLLINRVSHEFRIQKT